MKQSDLFLIRKSMESFWREILFRNSKLLFSNKQPFQVLIFLFQNNFNEMKLQIG